jgi:hypothetical protein
MPAEISERDWKLFKELHPIAMNRFFEKAVKEMQPLLWSKEKQAQERFLDALTYAQDKREQASRLFDDLRRSTALLIAGIVYANGFFTADEVSRFSPDAQQRFRTLGALRQE